MSNQQHDVAYVENNRAACNCGYIAYGEFPAMTEGVLEEHITGERRDFEAMLAADIAEILNEAMDTEWLHDSAYARAIARGLLKEYEVWAK